MSSLLNISLLLAGILQAFVIAAILWKKRKSNTATILMIAFIGTLTFLMIMKGLDKLWVETSLPWSLYNISITIPLLLCPLAFLYLRTSLTSQSLSYRDLVFVSPFLVLSVSTFIYSVTEWPPLATFYPNVYVDLLIQTLCFAYFLTRSIRVISGDTVIKGEAKIWYEEFCFAAFGLCFVTIAALKLMFFLFPDFEELRYLFTALPLFMYWLTYKALDGEALAVRSLLDGEAPIKNAKKEKYVKTVLSYDYATEVQYKLLAAMENEKPFTDPDLTLDSLSAKLNVPRHHVSQVLNEKLEKSFSDFINEYRVEMATRLLADPKNDIYTVAAIGFDCGFNSTSTFNMSFKRFKNMSPAAYRKQHLPVKKTA